MTKTHYFKNYNAVFSQSEINLRHLGCADARHLSAFQNNHRVESCLIFPTPSFTQSDTTSTLAGKN